jgi:hypothetical protein
MNIEIIGLNSKSPNPINPKNPRSDNSKKYNLPVPPSCHIFDFQLDKETLTK